MRIIGGTAGGRRLKTFKGRAIRPTADRVREALFALLSARYGLPEGARVLDLFAGTGALGLEALSRGAKSAIFVDRDQGACALIRENARALGFSQARVFCAEAAGFLKNAPPGGFDLVFLDPPYGQDLIEPTLQSLQPALGEQAIVIVEHAAREAPPRAPEGFFLRETRKYGTAALSILERETRFTVEASPLSARIRALKPSPTIAVSTRAKALRRKGVDVIDFGLGEPDFDTPTFIKEAAKRALDEGVTKYTEVAGVPQLREALAARATRELGLPFSAKEVIVGVGAKQLLFNLCLALLDPGDEAVIAAPYWVTYPELVELAGAKAVIVETSLEDDFRLDPEDLLKAMNEKTKLVFLNSPSNPTGAVLDLPRLRGIAEVLRRYPRALVISDEIYCAIHYESGRAPSLLHAAPDLRERVVVVDGASKSYAMTGWRLGWAIGPQPIIEAISALQSQSTSNAVSFAQMGLLAALLGDQSCVDEMVEEFHQRRDLVLSCLGEIPDVRVSTPRGAFYAFPEVKAYLGAPRLASFGEGALGLANYLLEEARVAMVPGSAFGAEGFLRISYALSKEQIKEGLGRLKDGLLALRA